MLCWSPVTGSPPHMSRSSQQIDMTSLPRSSPPPPPPLEDDNLLWEILLRLPPQPSSLPRASVVCKRWHHLATDHRFVRHFRRHHRRSPPLLGVFDFLLRGVSFQPTLEAPNRVPPGRFDAGDGFRRVLNSRHGLVLSIDWELDQEQVLVWDPVTGDQHSIPVPAGFHMIPWVQGAVLRAAGEVHHFQVVLVGGCKHNQQHTVIASVYSSEAGVWGNPISTLPHPGADEDNYFTDVCMHNVLVGDSLYWPLGGSFPSSYMLEFSLERQSLAAIELPVKAGDYTAMRAEGGGLGMLCVSESGYSAQLWKRNADRDDGVASWLLERTLELEKLLSLNSKEDEQGLMILGFAEYNNVVFLGTDNDAFMLDLGSLQVKKLLDTRFWHPFESVYALPPYL